MKDDIYEIKTIIKEKKRRNQQKRVYHFNSKQLEKLLESYESTGQFPNPFKKNGIYFYLIEALVHLGTDISHEFLTVKSKIQELMSINVDEKGISDWEYFCKKGTGTYSKDEKELSWDVNQRIIETIKLLQRVSGNNPHGYRLKQLYACLDFLPSTHPVIKHIHNVRLNTKFNCIEDVKPVRVKYIKKEKNEK